LLHSVLYLSASWALWDWPLTYVFYLLVFIHFILFIYKQQHTTQTTNVIFC